MKKLVEIKQLNKKYGEKTILHDLSFDIFEEEILCLLGPNGAGKSTTINVLTGSIALNSGEIFYQKKNIFNELLHFKGKVGIVPQELSLYEDLSAEDNVTFFASLYGLKGNKLKEQVIYALEFVGLKNHRKEEVKTFSGGMKRRLNIACAIAHQPELLIMDEPTVGIDPQSRNHILNAIKELRQAGMTILYTTHYMEEVEEIASRIIIIDHGKILATGTKEELKSLIKNEQQINIAVNDASLLSPEDLFSIEGVSNVEIIEQQLIITTLKNIENLDRIIGKISTFPVKILNISIDTANLETVFLNLTGRTLRD